MKYLELERATRPLFMKCLDLQSKPTRLDDFKIDMFINFCLWKNQIHDVRFEGNLGI